MTALGMIEVRGYLGAVSCADAALKAAAVQLSNAEIIRGGLTTVELRGDVAAVRAAVDAAATVARQLNCLISCHVIARVDQQTQRMQQSSKTSPLKNDGARPAAKILPVTKSRPEQQAPVVELRDSQKGQSADLEVPAAAALELEKLKVVELRTKAYQMNLRSLSKKEIKFAKKALLIEKILDELKGSER